MDETLELGDLRIDFATHAITLGGIPLDVSATEFDLLAHLARVAPQVVAPQVLAAQVQGYEAQSLQQANATLRYHFYRLRRKIKQATGRDDLIKTVHGVGYALYQHPVSVLPSGAITFLQSELAAASELWDNAPDTITVALARHDALIRENILAYGGHLFKQGGNLFTAAFAEPADALNAALSAQRALFTEAWRTPQPLPARMALHNGPAELADGEYVGLAVNLLGRLITLGNGGQILLSEAARDQIVRRLPPDVQVRDLGARRLKGIQEPTRVFQIVAPDLPAQFPPLKSAEPRPSNLPAPLTRFIGREWDTRQVVSLLRTDPVRLLTLTGVGGVGKTRLALQVAAHLIDEFEDGIFFVPLASIRDAELVLSAVARVVVSAQDSRNTTPEALGALLRSRQMLLLLDNFEQVTDAAPDLTALLSHAPYLKILVTSRHILRVYGEQNYPVAPLTTPDVRERIGLPHLERYEATRLWLERARAALPTAILTDADAPRVAEICAALDGLPLAIELAAARVAEFTLPDLAAQLNARLGFLSEGPRDLPARHRTLRGLLDWSYHLLSASEQALFARLAIFAGGWTRDAAHRVATWQGDDKQVDALAPEAQALDALLDKFLIHPQVGMPDQPRFTMLETLHEYALEQLSAREDVDDLAERHAAYFVGALERAEPDLMGGARQKSALWMCELDQDNFRAALKWALAHNRVELALRLVRPLWRFWSISSQFTEGRRALTQVLDASGNVPPVLTAPVWYGLSKLELFRGAYPAAQAAAERGLVLYRELDDADGIAWCLNALGEIASNLHEPSAAEEYFESSLELFNRVSDQLGIAKALDDLGRLAMDWGDYERAARLLRESLNLRRQRGSTEGIAVGLVALGEVLRLQGDYPQAELHTRESLALYRQLNHTAGIITCLYNLAEMRQAQNDPAQAIALYLEGLSLLRDLEDEEPELMEACLSGVQQALTAAGESDEAALVANALAQGETIDLTSLLIALFASQNETIGIECGGREFA